jgi:hypothetical protein
LIGGCWFFSLAMLYKSIWRPEVSGRDEKSEKIIVIR